MLPQCYKPGNVLRMIQCSAVWQQKCLDCKSVQSHEGLRISWLNKLGDECADILPCRYILCITLCFKSQTWEQQWRKLVEKKITHNALKCSGELIKTPPSVCKHDNSMFRRRCFATRKDCLCAGVCACAREMAMVSLCVWSCFFFFFLLRLT